MQFSIIAVISIRLLKAQLCALVVNSVICCHVCNDLVHWATIIQIE